MSRQQRRTFRRPSTVHSHPVLLEGLLTSGADAAFGPFADPVELDRHVLALVVTDPGVDSDGSLSGRLLRAVAVLHENGWQPADVVHVVAKQWTQQVGRLAAALLVQAAAQAPHPPPPEWAAQLGLLGPARSGAGAVVAGWRAREELTADDAWRDGLRLLGHLGRLPRIETLLPRPSEWAHPARPHTTPTAPEPRALATIRALLAKAESTEFPDEADALTAKAQDLMTRHAIDDAVLQARGAAGPDVLARRVHVDNPYASAKVQLLDAVGGANDVRVVWTESIGMATVVGHPGDLDLVELLFTSLLVQATHALAAAGRPGVVKSFRRGFLLAYAVRIGERLEGARAHARGDAELTYGTALVPVLAERSEAVDQAFATMFPAVLTRRRTRVDATGWQAGRAAADRADLGA